MAVAPWLSSEVSPQVLPNSSGAQGNESRCVNSTASSSPICAMLSAGPLRRLSPQTNRSSDVGLCRVWLLQEWQKSLGRVDVCHWLSSREISRQQIPLFHLPSFRKDRSVVIACLGSLRVIRGHEKFTNPSR